MRNQPDQILTFDDVAAHLNAGKPTFYRLAASGKLSALKLGGAWRFRRGDLDKWIASRIGKAMVDDGSAASSTAPLIRPNRLTASGRREPGFIPSSPGTTALTATVVSVRHTERTSPG